MREKSWSFEEKVWQVGEKEVLETKNLHSSSTIQTDYFKNVSSSQYLSKEGITNL